MNVYISGRRVRLDPRRSVGKGGEADVFALPGDQAVKVWKTPDHPDLVGLPDEQDGARQRIEVYQDKIREFPSGLPSRVIAPDKLATDRAGRRVLGYTMPLVKDAEVLLRFGDSSYRTGRIDNDTVRRTFLDLQDSVDALHQRGIVIGDFNDLNVLVRDAEAMLIDADSFQFGMYACQTYTTRLVDPLLCDPNQNLPIPRQQHTVESDWYAFTLMLMQSLLFVGPYGGVYRPKDRSKRLPHDARPLQRITVFDAEVRYPKPAKPLDVLPDDLLHYFHATFVQDARGPFPRDLLESTRWVTCSQCGQEHGRRRCPTCAKPVVKPVTRRRGKVAVAEVFRTKRLIVAATAFGGKLSWLYQEGDAWNRETGETVFRGNLDGRLRIRLRGEETLVGQANRLVRFAPGRSPEQLRVDARGTAAIFDANNSACYWVEGGRLLRDGSLGPEFIGDVLAEQTHLWVGDRFGFGFYRAGQLTRAFVFDAQRRGLNDSVSLLPLRGQLIDASCAFAKDRCWFLAATEEAGQTVRRCVVICSDGSIEATAESGQEDTDWLGTPRGHAAAGPYLFAATDDGIVRLEVNGGYIDKTREFPGTEPWVTSDSRLFLTDQGLYVVQKQTIRLLALA